MPKSVIRPFIMENLTEEEKNLLFGQPIEHQELPDNKIRFSLKRPSTINTPNEIQKKRTMKLRKKSGDLDETADKDCKFLNQFVIKHNNP